MYAYKKTRSKFSDLHMSVFNSGVFYEDTQKWKEFLELAISTNEIQGLITYFSSEQWRCDFHFIGTERDEFLQKYSQYHKYMRLPTHYYWKQEHYEKLYLGRNFDEYLAIAFSVIESIPPYGVAQVCGPISTGGRGSVSENLKCFNEAIQKLSGSKMKQLVFDQMPFEPVFQNFHEERMARGENGYSMDLLNKFYLPIFESGKIRKLFFLHDWKSSIGATWEHKQAERLGMEIEYLPENFV